MQVDMIHRLEQFAGLRYNIGVRVGSWGLAIAAASDVITSLVLSPIDNSDSSQNCVYVDQANVCHLNGCDDGRTSVLKPLILQITLSVSEWTNVRRSCHNSLWFKLHSMR